MSIELGVDLGTTFTSAVVSRNGTADIVSLETDSASMPSVVAFDGDQVLAGVAAERRLAESPSSGAREFKRRLGDTTPYILDGTPRGAEVLTSHLLRAVVERAGEQPDVVRVAHPANWGEYKLELLRDAGRLADLGEIELVAEPAAAAMQYATAGGLEMGALVAVYDFGGGTFDAAVVRVGESGAEVIGRPEGLERLGGVDIDQVVLAHVDKSLDGALGQLDTSDVEVRRSIVALRVACTEAKEALSADTDVTIPVRLPSLVTEVRMTRAELEAAVAPRIDDTLGALDRAVASAGVGIADLSGVLLVGGSSRMPMVAERIAEHTGRPVLTDIDHDTAVAHGAVAGAVVPTESVASIAAAPASAKAGASKPAAESKSASRSSRLGTIGRAAAAAGMMGAGTGGGYAAWRYFRDADGEEVIEDTIELTSDGSPVGAAETTTTTNPEVGTAARFAESATEAPAESAAAPVAAPAPDPGIFSPTPQGRIAAAVFQPAAVAAPPPAAAPATPAAATPAPAPVAPPPPPPPPPVSAIVSDPRIEEVRALLRERLDSLAVPEGADAEDTARLERDLDGLLDRFQPYPGQDTDDAVAALRFEFEDRVRDFAQDQRIDAVIEEQRRQVAEAEAVESEVGEFRDQLSERLDGWQAPAGADPAEAAELREALQGMIDRAVAIPGQSADDAIAELRLRFNDQVGDFAQDLKIDALVEEQRGDDTEPTETAETDPDAATSEEVESEEGESEESEEPETDEAESVGPADPDPVAEAAEADTAEAAVEPEAQMTAIIDEFDELVGQPVAVATEMAAVEDPAVADTEEAAPIAPAAAVDAGVEESALADTSDLVADNLLGGAEFAAEIVMPPGHGVVPDLDIGPESLVAELDLAVEGLELQAIDEPLAVATDDMEVDVPDVEIPEIDPDHGGDDLIDDLVAVIDVDENLDAFDDPTT